MRLGFSQILVVGFDSPRPHLWPYSFASARAGRGFRIRRNSTRTRDSGLGGGPFGRGGSGRRGFFAITDTLYIHLPEVVNPMTGIFAPYSRRSQRGYRSRTRYEVSSR